MEASRWSGIIGKWSRRCISPDWVVVAVHGGHLGRRSGSHHRGESSCLSASALLGYHGVPHILVERHAGTAIHPRAASFHQRSLEIFRQIGLQNAIEQAAEREFRQNGAIIAVESLQGAELATFYASFN